MVTGDAGGFSWAQGMMVLGWILHIQALGTSILIPLGFWGTKPGGGCSSQPSLRQREPGAGEFIH